MNLDENELEFEVKVDDHTISKNGSRFLAEASLASLDAETKKRAVIVPVTKSGKQFLLG